MQERYGFEILVSIIIPVYNAEKYLTACMDSVIRQTFKEIQIICVDDGSTDHSLQILEAYAGIDNRITVLHGMHKGAASARNMGMEYACGQYVCFWDSDDIFEADLIEELYKSAAEHNAEIAICEYDTNMNGTSVDYMDLIGKRYMGKYAQKAFCIRELPVDAFFIWNIAPWTKLYNLNFLKKNRLEFQQIDSANDLYFTVMAFIYADRIIHTSSYRAFVHYRVNLKEQISGRRTAMDVYAAWQKVYRQMQRTVQDKGIFQKYYAAVLLGLVFELSEKSEDNEQKKQFYQFFSQRGMKEIGLGTKLEGKNLQPYNEIQECFQKKSFESQWFLQKKRICMQLEQKGFDVLKKLCMENRVALWGVGANGLPVLRMFEQNGIRLEGVVDQDILKQGSKVCGYMINTYAKLRDQAEVIMITSKRAFNSICSDLAENEGSDIKILPLFMWLETEMELRDCILNLKKEVLGL